MSGPEWHAAINDFPVALLVASVVFDVWGTARKGADQADRAAVASYWCLAGGAATAVLAVISGLLVEGHVEKSPASERILESHESLGIGVALAFTGLAAWRIWRRNRLTPQERQSYLMISVAGALALLWLAHLGGTMVYDHATGIPTEVLRQEIEQRANTPAREP